MKKVSIICAFRDEARTLERCLISLLNQSYKNIEMILINDGSTDGSELIAEKFVKKYKNIKVINIAHTDGGCVRPRIIGIKNSVGEILFVVDADAYYSSDYLEKCIPYLSYKNVGGVIGKIRVWDPKTFISKYRDVQYRLRWDDVDNMQREIANGKIAAWIFRREVYEEIGGYDIRMKYGDDVAFTRKLLNKGYKVIYEPSALWYHRWSEYPLELIRNNLVIGKQNYTLNKGRKYVLLKTIYFLIPFPIVLVSFFYWPLIILLFFHTLPMFFRGIKFFRKSNSPYRKYALLSPLIAYISNIPFSISFILGFLKEDILERFGLVVVKKNC